MNSQEKLEIENKQCLNLMQALVGSISANFRRISLEVIEVNQFVIRFLLEKEAREDLEEIKDIIFEFEALQESWVEIEVMTKIDQTPIEKLNFPGRVIYGRRS